LYPETGQEEGYRLQLTHGIVTGSWIRAEQMWEANLIILL